jgi:four helix bundle protein
MRNFKQLLVWQKGFDISVNAYRFVNSLPKEEKFGLASQITRAAVSIPSNIAEGSSRSSTKDYSRYLEIALGSSYELETQLLITAAVNLGEKNQRAVLLKNILEEQKMLISFLNRLKT